MNQAMKHSEIEYHDGLPAELKKIVSPQRARRSGIYRPAIIGLLARHGECSVEQLIIGMYNNTDRVLTHKQMGGHLRELKRSGLIRSIRRGVYELTQLGMIRAELDGDDQ